MDDKETRIVKIYKPSKSAMQSGTKNTDHWILEFIQDKSKYQEPLMGWMGSCDTQNSQLRLEFSTLDKAKAYAEKNKLKYIVMKQNESVIKPKFYSKNFTSE